VAKCFITPAAIAHRNRLTIERYAGGNRRSIRKPRHDDISPSLRCHGTAPRKPGGVAIMPCARKALLLVGRQLTLERPQTGICGCHVGARSNYPRALIKPRAQTVTRRLSRGIWASVSSPAPAKNLLKHGNDTSQSFVRPDEFCQSKTRSHNYGLLLRLLLWAGRHQESPLVFSGFGDLFLGLFGKPRARSPLAKSLGSHPNTCVMAILRPPPRNPHSESASAPP